MRVPEAKPTWRLCTAWPSWQKLTPEINGRKVIDTHSPLYWYVVARMEPNGSKLCCEMCVDDPFALRPLRAIFQFKSNCKMCVVVPHDLEKGAAALPRFIPQSHDDVQALSPPIIIQTYRCLIPHKETALSLYPSPISWR